MKKDSSGIDLEELRAKLDEALTFLDFEEAQKLITQGLNYAHRLKSKFYEYFFRSQEAILNEDFTKAILYLNRALKLNPYDAECYNDKALCLVDTGKLPQALECVEQGLKLAGDHKLLYHCRGWIFIQMGRHLQAIANFRKALEFDEDYPACWANLAECLKQEADFDLALAYYKKALSLIPSRFKNLRRDILQEIKELKRIIEKKSS